MAWGKGYIYQIILRISMSCDPANVLTLSNFQDWPFSGKSINILGQHRPSLGFLPGMTCEIFKDNNHFFLFLMLRLFNHFTNGTALRVCISHCVRLNILSFQLPEQNTSFSTGLIRVEYGGPIILFVLTPLLLLKSLWKVSCFVVTTSHLWLTFWSYTFKDYKYFSYILLSYLLAFGVTFGDTNEILG